MMDKHTHCDKCGSLISNGKCSCGFWYDHKDKPPMMEVLERAILAYDFFCEQNNCENPITGDHHSGNAIALFKGDYADCMKVKEFINRGFK